MIFQHFNLLWSRTVLENIELPLELAGIPKIKRRERAQELVKLVGLEGREKAYPFPIVRWPKTTGRNCPCVSK